MSLNHSSQSSQHTDTTTQTQNQNFLYSPTNPDWVNGGVQGVSTTLSGLNTRDPSSYVAGPDALQTAAAHSLSGLTPNAGAYSSANGLYQGVMDAGGPHVKIAQGQAASALPGINSYLSPYTNDVVKASLADYNYGAGQQQAADKLSIAGMDDTMGGSNGAILQSLDNGQIARGRASLVSGLLDQGFTQAGQLANQDADRSQQMSLANTAALNQGRQFNAGEYDTGLQRQLAAAQGMTQNANDQTTAGINVAGAQSSIGQVLQALAQARAQAPLSVAGSLAGDWNSLPLSLFNGKSGVVNSTGSGTDVGSGSGSSTGFGVKMSLPFFGGGLGG